jgi:PAS domain S-box-containing protein
MGTISTVLLIEDNSGDARLVTEYLRERFGGACRVREVSTLAAGLQALTETSVDVVLLDLGLPDSSGLDAYFQIHAQAPQTPVVILTGDRDEDKAIEALRVGAEDYLAKSDTDGVTLIRSMRHAVQRRALVERLRDSESRFRALVEAAEQGILQVDRTGSILMANDCASRMLGIPAGSDSTTGLLSHPFPAVVAPTHRVAASVLLGTPPGERATCELQLTRTDGSPCWVVAASGGVTAPTGVDPGVVVLLTDITGRKLAEEELRSLKDELELRVVDRTAQLAAANAELQAINRAMAHDLRNPLNGILGLTRVVRADKRNPLPAMAERRLQLIEQSALDMNELIGSLLSLARLGQQAMSMQALDLSAMASAVAEQLSLGNPGRNVRWQIAPRISGVGDPALMAAVLQNLIHNAWKYSERASQADIAFDATPSARGLVYFVRDNGIGFDMTTAGDLFSPFHRLPSSRGFPGNGVGLASVKRIVERHGGSVWAESEPGVSTTIYFTLTQ